MRRFSLLFLCTTLFFAPKLFGQCSPSGTDNTVNICSPSAGATVNSPVNFQAATTPPSGQTVTAMKLYVDGTGIFTSNGATLSTSQTLANGSHAITIKGWTNTGAIISAKETITVTTSTGGGGCNPTASTVTICAPSSGSTLPSPVTVQAVAGAPSGQSITAMKLYVDGVSKASSSSGTLTSAQTIASGAHKLSVNAWTSTGAVLKATENITVTGSTGGGGGGGTVSVLTYMYNNARTGANTQETSLTPANVNSTTFGMLGSWSLDAASYTEPLYVPGVPIGSGTFNVVYVGTENDSVYALNADSPGTVLWKRSFLTSTRTIGLAYKQDSQGRTSLGGNIGITGTPVIDKDNNCLYVVGRTTESNQQVQRLYVIDIRTGADVISPVAITGSVSGTGDESQNGVVNFDAMVHNQRPGLLLSNGIVYTSFASFGDNTPYHGWVQAYNASSLTLMDAFNTTPNGSGGGVWSSGAALAADDSGNVYFATGNAMPYATGVFNPPTDLPQSLLKLGWVGSNLTLIDYFSPYNAVCLTADDLDLGSSAPTLIPDNLGGHNLIALGSKEGRAYLVDRDNMGKFHSGNDSQIPASVLFNPKGACGVSGFDASSPWRVYGSPVYWNGNLYFGSAFGPLRQYNISSATFLQKALGTHNYPGSSQSGRGPLAVLSANGSSNGIVWTLENDLSGNGWLRAYDANNVATQLYSTSYGAGKNFIIPTVVNGRVYIASSSTVYVYGLK